MTDQTGRPDDETRPDGTTPRPEQPQGRDDAPESVLAGFSWDDQSGPPPRRPEDDTQVVGTDGADRSYEEDGASPSNGSSVADPTPSYTAPPSYDAGPSAPGAEPQAPAQYPPAAPYPPAGAPYGQTASYPEAGAQPDPYAQGGQPYAQAGTDPQGGGQAYGQQAAPYAASGYGPSAQYTSTPQPYAYGPPPLSPEADSVRSKAILWTILNSVSLVLGLFVLVFNIPSLVGLILGAMAIGRTRTDLDSARGLVRWSWILFVIGIVLAVIWWVVLFALFASVAAGTPGLLGEF